MTEYTQCCGDAPRAQGSEDVRAFDRIQILARLRAVECGGTTLYERALANALDAERARREKAEAALSGLLDPGGQKLEGLVLTGWQVGLGLDDRIREARAYFAEQAGEE